MIVVLAGGVGAARFLRGLVRVVPPERITVIGNTGDDINIYAVHVSPDLDIVTYTLAGVVDDARGFGIRSDTHRVLDELRAAGEDAWFGLGDRDFGVCVARTLLLGRGMPLHEITARIARRFGLGVRLIPMTDDPVHTVVTTNDGRAMHFQEYWVRERGEPPVGGVHLHGGAEARPAPGVLEAIDTAEAIIVAPSNPVVSVGTILAVPGVRDALRAARAPVVGVSPIIGGAVVRGMADRLLPAVGAEVSAAGVAGLYADFLDGFLIDEVDGEHASAIEGLEMAVDVAATLMRTEDDAAGVAKAALALAERAR